MVAAGNQDLRIGISSVAAANGRVVKVSRNEAGTKGSIP
jgi:hypothetical protein